MEFGCLAHAGWFYEAYITWGNIWKRYKNMVSFGCLEFFDIRKIYKTTIFIYEHPILISDLISTQNFAHYGPNKNSWGSSCDVFITDLDKLWCSWACSVEIYRNIHRNIKKPMNIHRNVRIHLLTYRSFHFLHRTVVFQSPGAHTSTYYHSLTCIF